VNARLETQNTLEAVEALFELPFTELIHRAQSVHREHFDPAEVQLATLLSIKTGGCPEDCAYCPQSAHYDTGIDKEALLGAEQVRAAARAAREAGATRFCMGAAWRSPKARDLERVIDLVKAVKAEGLQTCVTLGMLQPEQAVELKAAGLDYYNHNLDTAPELYGSIITTRTYQDRLDTLSHVREAGISVCCGGIVGMGENRRQRAGLLLQLAELSPHPESVPINALVRVAGTPLASAEPIDPFEFVRTIAVARLLMPKSVIRLSAGRQGLGEAVQALCFLAGANSIFYGDQLLTTGNVAIAEDRALLAKLGLRPAQATGLGAP
jgi:biotin synthase